VNRPADAAIRLLLADDNPEVLANLAKMLTPGGGIEIVGIAKDADEAIARAASSQPDVVLTDVNMPLGGGVHATEGIRAASPQTHVVAHSAYEDRGAVMQMVRAGAIGYILKGAPTAELIEVIRRAARGEAILSASITSTVIHELATLLRQKKQAADAQRSHQAVFRRFIKGEGMTVLFQPLIDLAGGGCVGYEALARFDQGPDRSPRDWFEEAGTVGFRLEMEFAAIKLALDAIDRLPAPMFLEVNASPATVASPELDRLLDARADGRLVIDVSAQDHAHDYDAFHAGLRQLRRRGIRLAVDDLGAVDAGLQHLLELDPEVIKLDTAIVQAMGGRPSFKALARSLVAFGRETRATVVAVGVEQPEDLDLVRAMGVNWVQGFLFGVPDSLDRAAPRAPS
jgi:EAL domain-containing protein (putative c-di-GMP-specific phosphodiesterase class I)